MEFDSFILTVIFPQDMFCLESVKAPTQSDWFPDGRWHLSDRTIIYGHSFHRSCTWLQGAAVGHKRLGWQCGHSSLHPARQCSSRQCHVVQKLPPFCRAHGSVRCQCDDRQSGREKPVFCVCPGEGRWAVLLCGQQQLHSARQSNLHSSQTHCHRLSPYSLWGCYLSCEGVSYLSNKNDHC